MQFETNDLSVLLVEDNRHMISILRNIFQIGKIRDVHHATDAVAALEILNTSPIDIAIFSDAIEGISALDLTNLIREAPDSPQPDLPIIFLMAQPTKRHLKQAIDAGASFCIKQPLSAQLLLERIKWSLDKAREEDLDCAPDDAAGFDSVQNPEGAMVPVRPFSPQFN